MAPAEPAPGLLDRSELIRLSSGPFGARRILTTSTQIGDEIRYEKDERALSADPRWLLAQRIAASQHLAKATQLRDILLYVVRQALVSQPIAIKEQEIACNVLGRRGDFDPSDDNIVRVQVGHLRKKLDSYFSAEGADEPLELSIPRGTYVPRFTSRVRDNEHVSVQAHEPSVQVAKAPTTPFIRWREYLQKALLMTATAVVFYLLGWLSFHQRLPSSTKTSAWHNPLVNRVFLSDLPISVVVADASLVVLQNSLHTDISIDDYISKDYPSNILGRAEDKGEVATLRKLAPRRFTSLADLNVAIKCDEIAHDLGSKTNIIFARYLNARNFEKGNFILIGSRVADPWVALFEPKLNFAFEEDPESHIFHFRNKHPTLGEQSIYVPDIYRGPSSESYVDIAILPNLTKTGYVILFDGASMEANEAAMDFIFAKDMPSAIPKSLCSNLASGTCSVEIFLRDKAIDGVVSGFDVVSVRQISS
jgi:hypothetical protein